MTKQTSTAEQAFIGNQRLHVVQHQGEGKSRKALINGMLALSGQLFTNTPAPRQRLVFRGKIDGQKNAVTPECELALAT